MLKVVGASWFQTTLSLSILIGIMILGIVIIVASKYRSEDDGKYAGTVSWNPYAERLEIKLLGQNNDPNEISRGVARAYYQSTMLETGWAILELESNAEYPDNMQAFAAGMLEGSLSWSHIYWHWTNTIQQPCIHREKFCEDIRNFLRNNTVHIRKKSEENDKTDPFWHQVKLFYDQLDGIEFGWNYEARQNKYSDTIPKIDFLWMNILSDLKNINESTKIGNVSLNSNSAADITVLKLLFKNDSKVVLAHATSGQYSSMLRIQKKYKFNYHRTGSSNAALITGHTISFTSYPASIHSQDEFYQIKLNKNTRVTIAATALNFGFTSIKAEAVEQVLTGPRVMAANRLSKDGKSWSSIMKTYSTELDYKQWLHIKSNQAETEFWVLEHTPKKIICKDETNFLYKRGYWINCGSPFYHDQKKYNKTTDSSVSHTSNTIIESVEIILETGLQNVSNLESLIALMRGPELSLAGRTDLHLTYEISFDNVGEQKYVPRQLSIKSGEKIPPKFVYYILNTTDYIIFRNETWYRNLRLKSIISISHHSNNKQEAKLTNNARESENNAKNVKTKNMRSIKGIIDLKVSTEDGNFLAAAGPPFTLDDKKKTIDPFQWSTSRIRYLPHDGHSDTWNYKPINANFVWD